jgi:cytoskeletal protein CcmA (bactofilin family)
MKNSIVTLLLFFLMMPLAVLAQDGGVKEENFENDKSLTVINSKHDGDLNVTVNTRINGKVTGNVKVNPGMKLVVNGKVQGNVDVANDAKVIINGGVDGNVIIGKGAVCRIRGKHKGQLTNNGGKFVSN